MVDTNTCAFQGYLLWAAFSNISVNSYWKATVCQRQSFNVNRHVFENTADIAEVFLDLAFLWQKMPDLSGQNVLGNMLTEQSTDSRMFPWKSALSLDHVISPLLSPHLCNDQHGGESGSQEWSSKHLQSKGVPFLGSLWSECWFWKTVFHSGLWWESNPGSSYPQIRFYYIYWKRDLLWCIFPCSSV